MKLRTHVLTGLLVLNTFYLHGQLKGELPKEVLSILDSKYPAWYLVDNLNVIKDLHLDTTKCRPNLVWGDFDDNGKRDYVTFIERQLGTNPRERFLLAFLRKGSNFQEFLLDQGGGDAYIADLIWLAEKGSKSYDFEHDKEFVLKRDAVDLIFIEKASDLFYFDRGQFKRITTSD